VAARLLQAPPTLRRVGSRGAAGKSNKQGALERFPPLFSSLPVVAFTVTCNKKRETQTVCFKFFFVDRFSSAFHLDLLIWSRV
jgi:hypothetical protein